MKHSQQPSIDILKKRASKYSWVEWVKIKSILLNIASDVSRLPQELTTDNLLDEMEAVVVRRNGEWRAYTLRGFEYEYQEAFWASPRLALLALKEKLKTI